MWLFVAFLLVPLIEIALFIQIGGAIGLGLTLLIVVITAVIGTYLVRAQGIHALGQVKSSFNQLQDPSEALAHGAMILFSGALLLTPGFFTDAVGFALLVPGVRVAVFNWARTKIKVSTFASHPPPQHQSGTIDGTYTDVTKDQTESDQPSGWTKH
ncbi:FxsA family protein [uncultured Tateyamaria sp.]|uniref:FxsA family protein n=1 Tax=uncultured Tateyamaria sp. TaxID=455651 RepID=UPI00261A2D12|nr:FxsA family protein [uncultured Tateyamaria sp.]